MQFSGVVEHLTRKETAVCIPARLPFGQKHAAFKAINSHKFTQCKYGQSFRERKWRMAAETKSKAPVDRTLSIKISLAKISGSLDLSWLGLETLDPQIFELTDLRELTIAGNRLRKIPEEISQLKNLEKLQAAGNLLEKLPDSFTELSNLQGLWLHGNTIQNLPQEIGKMSSLETVSLAGNCLKNLPESISGLSNLTELSLSGNQIEELPAEFGKDLGKLKTLSLNGNSLESIPSSIGKCSSLENLHLQSNGIKQLPDEVVNLENLKELNLSDNCLHNLPEEWKGISSCESIWLYGNQIKQIPDGFLASQNLECLWTENNPLEPAKLCSQIQGINKQSKMKELGLDTEQMSNLEAEGLQIDNHKFIVSGTVPESKKGYFKLRHAACKIFDPSKGAKVLVVTFASAPGTPNWGGLLGKYVSQAGPDENEFDILYVCDGSRNWYFAGDEGFKFWEEEIGKIAKKYQSVILLGDSMGASAALLFSHLATTVQAFTPQVNLADASIRPGKSQAWLENGRERILESVKSSSAKILVHTGTWDHDLEQAKLLPADKCELVVHHLDSHRLAIALHSQGQLLPIIRKSILSELGLYAAPRLVNLL